MAAVANTVRVEERVLHAGLDLTGPWIVFAPFLNET